MTNQCLANFGQGELDGGDDGAFKIQIFSIFQFVLFLFSREGFFLGEVSFLQREGGGFFVFCARK